MHTILQQNQSSSWKGTSQSEDPTAICLFETQKVCISTSLSHLNHTETKINIITGNLKKIIEALHTQTFFGLTFLIEVTGFNLCNTV